ncbi:MAG: S-layer homology domain-containing protein [Actinobacteria bacterium]|nr:S-layer homology domain-containing protein [Actinomycetota bacterium]
MSGITDGGRQLPTEGECAQSDRRGRARLAARIGCVAGALILALCLLGLIPGGHVANATTLKYLTLEEMAQVADRVVLAKADRVSSHTVTASTGSGADIKTIVDLEILDIIKGGQVSRLSLDLPGGTMGKDRVVADYVPSFTPNETCLLFLDAENRVVGGPQGKLAVVDGRVPALDISVSAAGRRVEAASGGVITSKSYSAWRPRPASVGLQFLQAAQDGLSDGFEVGLGNWIVTGSPSWGTTTYRANSGTHSAYCAGSAITAPGPYSYNMNAWMVAGPFDLSQVSSASLDYRLYLNTEANYDWFAAMASTDGTNFLGDGWSGSSGGAWADKSLDLTEWAGQRSVWVAFVFNSDNTVNLEGAYVDDVRLITNGGVPPSTPVISSISPSSGSSGTGTQVTVHGLGFGNSRGGGSVDFYGDEEYVISASIVSWTDTAIGCIIPTGVDPTGYEFSAGSGPVTVTNSSGRTSAGYDFHVTFGYGGMRWDSASVGFRVNPNAPGITRERELVDAAAETWSEASAFSLRDTGTCSTTNQAYDGHNDVLWSPYDLPYGVLAATQFRVSGSRLTECDLVFNASSSNHWGDGSGGTYDIQSIALHEFGHWLMLNDLYGPGDTAKVMYGYGETGEIVRELTPDDAAGAVWIYGRSSTTTTTSSSTTITSSTTTSSTTTTTIPSGQYFSDVPQNHPYAAQIYDLANRAIISGFPDGTFRPDASLSRQQFAKVIVLTLGLPVSEDDICPFIDVMTSMPSADPLYPDHYVAVCAAQGITLGKTPSSFAPYDSIYRAQLITMVSRAANLGEPPQDYVPPFGVFDATHYPFARKAAYAGLLDGIQGMGPYFAFFHPATRGEVCALLYNLLY